MSKITDIIKNLDVEAGKFGFSENGFDAENGFDENFGLTPMEKKMVMANRRASNNLPVAGKNNVMISANPAIQNRTNGQSTFQVNVKVKKTNRGAPDSDYPVFLFGGKAFTNAFKSYTAVDNQGQSGSIAFLNGKNVIVLKYIDPIENTNFTEFIISLSTAGEYPYVLNSLADRALMVKGVQLQVVDPANVAQLDLGISKFSIDEFGKSTTNDLTTPTDLYQLSTKGVFIPHQFKISGDEGIINRVLNIDRHEVNYFFYATKA